MPEAMRALRPAQALSGERRGWLWLGLLCAMLIALRGAILLYDHSLHSIDGAMQTWFALDNFADGAKLGEEFQSYLGITMILGLLPVFMGLGETLWASTLAAYAWVIAGCFAGAYAIVAMLRFVPKRQRPLWAIILIFAFYYAGQMAFGLVGLSNPATFDPGVSLRPLRGALPFFVLPFFVWSARRLVAGRKALPASILGLVAGVGLLWSNDAGIPLVIACALGLVMVLWRDWALLMKALFAFALGVILSALAVLLAFTHGNPSGWLEYNFVDVAGDQFWYFAPWNADARVLGLIDLPRIFWAGDVFASASLIVLTACVLAAIARRLKKRGSPVRMGAFIFVGASIVGTALLPQIGGHIGSEYKAITFVLGLCAPVILFQRPIFRYAKPFLRALPAKASVFLAGGASALMVMIDGSQLAAIAGQSERTVYSEKLGFYVTQQTAEELAAMERLSAFLGKQGFAPNARLLSVYTSALDIAAGTKSPAPVGSLIHALGERNRKEFNALLPGKAVAVTTIAPDYTGWAGWNMRANWSFFQNLHDLYRPIARTDQHILWIRGGAANSPKEAQCEVNQTRIDRMEVVITSPQEGIASLYIEREAFDASSRTAALTISEDSPFTRSVSEPQWSDFPRYGVANSQIVRTMAPVETGESTRLTFEMLDGSAIGWASCHARVYAPVDFGALPGLAEGIDGLIGGAGS